MAAVERLRGDLASAQLGRFSAELDSTTDRVELHRLIDHSVALEAELRASRREAETWRLRYRDLEQEFLAYTAKEDATRQELNETRRRERELSIEAVERRIAGAEEENKEIRFQAEARAKACEAAQLSAALSESEREACILREELEQLREVVAKSSANGAEASESVEEAARRRSGTAGSAAEVEAASVEAARHVEAALAALTVAERKEANMARELEAERVRSVSLDEANRRLRLDLQEMIAQAVRTGEVPFYAGGAGHNVEACLVPLRGESLPPSPPWTPPLLSKSDARQAHHQAKREVFDGRQRALDRIDQLGA
mmetsp:Transcript_53360/g.114688  ORF Transcript_53360/g.114688 Transcript_53360/m.114688 type:complete len:315 (+) Transcript_53360:75-1019(+)